MLVYLLPQTLDFLAFSKKKENTASSAFIAHPLLGLGVHGLSGVRVLQRITPMCCTGLLGSSPPPQFLACWSWLAIPHCCTGFLGASSPPPLGSSLVGLGWSPTPYDALGSSVPRPPPCSSLVGPGSATNGVGSEGLGISNLF